MAVSKITSFIILTVSLFSLQVNPRVNASPARLKVAECPSDCPHSFYLPLVFKAGGLIINHNNIDITMIPTYWLDQAKLLTFHYAHTSHGSQIISGLEYLKTYVNSEYAFAIQYGGTPPILPAGSNILKIYDGNNYDSGNYITPEMYWYESDGISHTISTANTNLFEYSMWSWCGQADTSDNTYINKYLLQMSSFEHAYPAMRFILMTGHNVINPGSNLLARNQEIRDYALTHKMILFDFADIETYDPDGGFHNPVTNNYWDGSCPWCDRWCDDHPDYCDDNMLSIDCAHTHPLFCKMKAQAFWWMMARLAGWSGLL